MVNTRRSSIFDSPKHCKSYIIYRSYLLTKFKRYFLLGGWISILINIVVVGDSATDVSVGNIIYVPILHVVAPLVF